MNKNAYSTLDLSARSSAQMGIKMKIIRQYLAFASRSYRIVMFGVLPVVFPVLYAAVVKAAGRGLMWLAAIALVSAEIMADNWLFGGIQSKYAEKLNYLRLSPRGMGLLRNALAMDLVRRFLFIAAGMAFCLPIELILGVETAQGSVCRLSFLALTAYIVSVLCTLAVRFSNAVEDNILAGSVGAILELACSSLSNKLPGLPALNMILAVLAAVASVLTVRTAMKHI